VRDLILLLAVGVALPVAIARPWVGIMLWMWFGLMNPHRLAYGLAYSLPFSQVIIATTLAGIIFSKEPKKLKGGVATGVLITFILWMLVTSFFALVPEMAIPMLDRVIKIQIGTLLALVVLYRREHVHAAIWVIVLSIGFYSVKGGAFTLLTLGQYRVWGPTDSYIFDNNALALATVMTIPLWFYLYAQHSHRLLRIIIICCAGLSAVSVFGSYSRGAFLAITAMAFFLWVKSRRKALVGVLLVLIGIGLIAFMPEQWEGRMNTLRDPQSEDSAASRLETWKALWALALDRPFIGGGFEPYAQWIFDLYNPGYGRSYTAHSIWFQVLAEHGFTGLLLWIFFWILVWRMCSKVAKLADGKREFDWAQLLARMIKVGLVGFFVGGSFLNLAYWDMPYYYFVCVAVTLYVLQRSVETRSPATTVVQPPRSTFAA